MNGHTPFIAEASEILNKFLISDVVNIVIDFIDVELLMPPGQSNPNEINYGYPHFPHSDEKNLDILVYTNGEYYSARYDDRDKYAYKLIKRHIDILFMIRTPMCRNFWVYSYTKNYVSYMCINMDFFPEAAKCSFIDACKKRFRNWSDVDYTRTLWGYTDDNSISYAKRRAERRNMIWYPRYSIIDHMSYITPSKLSHPDGPFIKFRNVQVDRPDRHLDNKFAYEAL